MSLVVISPSTRYEEGRHVTAPAIAATGSDSRRAPRQPECACPDFCEIDHSND